MGDHAPSLQEACQGLQGHEEDLLVALPFHLGADPQQAGPHPMHYEGLLEEALAWVLVQVQEDADQQIEGLEDACHLPDKGKVQLAVASAVACRLGQSEMVVVAPNLGEVLAVSAADEVLQVWQTATGEVPSADCAQAMPEILVH